jgi:MFS family permease
VNRKKTSTDKGPSPVYTYLRIASTFGITLAANIYILSVLLGGWLDERYGTSVLFRLIFLFVALLSAFMYLWKRVVVSERVEKEMREEALKEAAEKEALDHKIEALKRGLK